MTLDSAVEYVESYRQRGEPVQITNEFLASITPEIAVALKRQFAATTLMYLPESEVKFFTWLHRYAPQVWSDLWSTGDDSPVEYTVGLGLLEDVLNTERGYPICDITVEPLYYFTMKHVYAEEAKPLYDAILARVEQKLELSLRDIMLLEIRSAPIDIWRLAYLYGTTPEVFKKVADNLVADEILRLTPTIESLSLLMEDELPLDDDAISFDAHGANINDDIFEEDDDTDTYDQEEFFDETASTNDSSSDDSSSDE